MFCNTTFVETWPFLLQNENMRQILWPHVAIAKVAFEFYKEGLEETNSQLVKFLKNNMNYLIIEQKFTYWAWMEYTLDISWLRR